ncbi:PREDICTED: uncharacterized protein LOC109474707 [Branchiostoma belcheri]|uniref:Uncharacterized protein LOC109474707 n=1 Tax=Branchiostoma belcheri TaxID=7741 RepID=A0A6P4Z9K1_BRABE|nr:PREDICTED: uncharacterized protein LOC109474707 [Branchiostoma belcheri]
MSQCKMPPLEPGPVIPGYGDPVFFNETERAYGASLVFRGEVEKRVNNGEAFTSYRPVSFQAQVVEGINYKIQVEVRIWLPAPIEPPEIVQKTVEMTVYWGLPPAIPKLTDAKILEPVEK